MCVAARSFYLAVVGEGCNLMPLRRWVGARLEAVGAGKRISQVVDPMILMRE